MMHVYAAMIGFLRTQRPYRDTVLDQVAMYLEEGPARYARGEYALPRSGSHKTVHQFEALCLWDMSLEELVARLGPESAAFGPFCAGNFDSTVVASRDVLLARQQLDPDQTDVLKMLWIMSAQRICSRGDPMAKLNLDELLECDDIKNGWLFQRYQEKGYREGIEKGIEEGIEKGIEKGREAGRREAIASLLSDLLCERFGELPGWAVERIAGFTTPAQAEEVIRRLGSASRIEDAL